MYLGIFISRKTIALGVNAVTPADPWVHCVHSQKKSLTAIFVSHTVQWHKIA